MRASGRSVMMDLDTDSLPVTADPAKAHSRKPARSFQEQDFDGKLLFIKIPYFQAIFIVRGSLENFFSNSASTSLRWSSHAHEVHAIPVSKVQWSSPQAKSTVPDLPEEEKAAFCHDEAYG